jgi:hypothetical protein
MTLRELLSSAHLQTVYFLINKKDGGMEPKKLAPTMEQTTTSYQRVITELLGKRKTKKYSMPILVKLSEDWFDKHKYPDVCFLNPTYVAPRKGLKPWGGKPPKGHYNCNLKKHSQTYAMGFTPWSKIIDTPVINEGGFSNEQLLAEILWELTFYGWTEAKSNAKTKALTKTFIKAKKEIAKGKYTELKPTKKGGFKVIIPNSVNKQIADLLKKMDK